MINHPKIPHISGDRWLLWQYKGLTSKIMYFRQRLGNLHQAKGKNDGWTHIPWQGRHIFVTKHWHFHNMESLMVTTSKPWKLTSMFTCECWVIKAGTRWGFRKKVVSSYKTNQKWRGTSARSETTTFLLNNRPTSVPPLNQLPVLAQVSKNTFFLFFYWPCQTERDEVRALLP